MVVKIKTLDNSFNFHARFSETLGCIENLSFVARGQVEVGRFGFPERQPQTTTTDGTVSARVTLDRRRKPNAL